MVNLSQLIAHRFRGFTDYENSLDGLGKALDYGVKQIEFDIRVTKCGTPLIYHDEHAPDKHGQQHYLKDIMANQRQSLGGVFAHMPSAQALFAAIAAHKNQDVKILIDMKDAGFESMLYALVRANDLQDRALWVSWLPETLYAIHDIDPSAALCLSHWCAEPTAKDKDLHKIYTAIDGHIKRPERRYVHGERSGWYVKGPVQGELRDILSYICVPQGDLSLALVEDYRRDNIAVSAFSYVDWQHINQHNRDYRIDDYFIDAKSVFTEIL